MAKILIIEDDSTFSQLLEGFLTKHGHQPEVVNDVKKSLKLLDQKSFDLLLIDYRLPDGKGTEIIEFLQNLPLWKKVPVLLLSGEMNIGALAQVAGITSFIPKPPNLPDLVRKLGQITQSNQTE